MMLNFAEFNSSNLTGKVLEQAFVRYSHNKHLKIQLGQFRPYFGIEDEIRVGYQVCRFLKWLLFIGKKWLAKFPNRNCCLW